MSCDVTFSNSGVYPLHVFTCFLLFSELAVILFLNGIDRLIFVVEVHPVYREVRTELLYSWDGGGM